MTPARISGPECSRPGCHRPVYANGLCQPHATQARAFPLAAINPDPTTLAGYLSDTGFSITLEITGGDPFTLADVDAAIGGVRSGRAKRAA